MSNHREADGLILVGLFLLAGFVAHVLGNRVHVPRVSLLLLLGFIAGPIAARLSLIDAGEIVAGDNENDSDDNDGDDSDRPTASQ